MATWLKLLLLTVLLNAGLQLVHLPASALIGSICAAVIISITANTEKKLPRTLFFSAQGVIGYMIAKIFTVSMLLNMVQNWKMVLFSSLSIMLVSIVLGWVMTVRRVFPGSTAMWGSWPGAATVMVILSEFYGADTRMVAFMQYMRVMMVSVLAAVVGKCIGVAHTENIPLLEYYFPAFNGFDLFITIVFVVFCVFLAKVTRIGGGPLLIPIFLGAILNNLGIIHLELPQWVLTLSFVIIGWDIGLRFTKTIVAHAVRALPQVLASIFILLLLCGGIAVIMVHLGIDPLTAYLATSPGGADAVAIIAASIDVDMEFIMSVQWSRFLLILIIGPHIAKLLGRYFLKKQSSN